MGLIGVGGGVAVYVEEGLLVMGAGVNGSAGVGAFWGGQYGFNVGGYISGGAYAGGSFPLGNYRYGTQYPFGAQNNYAAGATAGGGVGLFFTNATCAEGLNGISKTYSANLPWISLQYGYSDGTFIISGTIMPSKVVAKIPALNSRGPGDISGYATTTYGGTLVTQRQVEAKVKDILR